MKLTRFWRSLWPSRQVEEEVEPPLGLDDDPFAEPVVIEIRDVIDLHSIPPRQIKEIVEEYLRQAQARGFRHIRIIHGKGIGVQREAVRKILSRTPFVNDFYDAPPHAGGLGATMAELNQDKQQWDARRDGTGSVSDLQLDQSPIPEKPGR